MRLTRAIALPVLLALGACGSSASVDEPTTSVPVPVFSQCDEIECARLTVPVSRSDSSLGTLELGVYRRRGSAPQTRPLFVHPGGPGSDVKELVATADQFLGADVERFDIIGLATRATPDVNPAKCVDSLDDFVAAITEDSAAERIADGCVAGSPALVGHSGTLDAVDDLEQLVGALGLVQVDFLGWSYGATIGAAWEMLHPGSLRAVVLDAPMDPSQPWAGQFRAVLDAQQSNMAAFLDECAATKECALGKDADGRLQEIAGRVDGVSLGIAAELAMYDAEMGKFARAAVDASAGDESALSAAVDARLGRTASGKDDSGMEAQVVVRCSDTSHADAQAAVDTARTHDPRTIPIGMGAAFERICLHLPEPSRPIGSVLPDPASRSANVLVISTSLDAAVPAAVSRAMAERMGWGSHTVDAAVHLAVGFDKTATVLALDCLVNTICH